MELHFSNCDFNYLRPSKDVFNVNHSEYYIRHGEGKKAIRKIFANGKFYDDEFAKLQEFKALIASEKLTLPPNWTETDTFRYMYSGKLDLKKSLKILKSHLEWKVSPDRGVLGLKAQKLMEDGIMYISGRDKQYRPIIVVNAHRADLKRNSMRDLTQTICFVLDVAQKYYFVPGKVENWVIIIESNGAGVLDFPTKLVKAINDVAADNYSATLDKIYIMNPSSFLKKSWSLVQSLLDPETATKINMLTKDEFPQLLERISRDQLEQCYGGTLPARKVFWPPINTLNQPPYTEDTVSTSNTTHRTISDKAAEQESQRAPAVTMKMTAEAEAIAEAEENSNGNAPAKDKSGEETDIEEWNYKGRFEAEARLDDSDEQVEIGEVKQSATHYHLTASRAANEVATRNKLSAASRVSQAIVLENSASKSPLCTFCLPGKDEQNDVNSGCNIF